jgi:DNA-binding NarL/FixJ family response regulator
MTFDIVFLSDDLMFSPRVTGQAQAAGWSVRETASSTTAIDLLRTDSPRLLIVDLETPNLDITQLLLQLPETNPPKVLAFGPHVHHQRLESARQAGCELVVSRGRFSSDLPALLHECLGSPDDDTTTRKSPSA